MRSSRPARSKPSSTEAMGATPFELRTSFSRSSPCRTDAPSGGSGPRRAPGRAGRGPASGLGRAGGGRPGALEREGGRDAGGERNTLGLGSRTARRTRRSPHDHARPGGDAARYGIRRRSGPAGPTMTLPRMKGEGLERGLCAVVVDTTMLSGLEVRSRCGRRPPTARARQLAASTSGASSRSARTWDARLPRSYHGRADDGHVGLARWSAAVDDGETRAPAVATRVSVRSKKLHHSSSGSTRPSRRGCRPGRGGGVLQVRHRG